MTDLSITVASNVSALKWQQNPWVCGAGDDKSVNWTDRVTSSPSPQLGGLMNTTSATAETEHLGSLVQDALYMELGYYNLAIPTEGFAVAIMRRFHLVGFGKGDVWRTGERTASGEDPSAPNNGITWSDWTENTDAKIWQFDDCIVTATPTLTNESAAVLITININTGKVNTGAA